MSAYTTQAAIQGRIPAPLLINALDDGLSGGLLNTTLLNQIIGDVSAELDGYLSSIYPVPYLGSIPPALADACLHMVCAVIMSRRLAPNEMNVWRDSAEKWRMVIQGYGEGTGNLGPNFPKQVVPGVATQEWASMDMTMG
jgi:phage gp36-like protein